MVHEEVMNSRPNQMTPEPTHNGNHNSCTTRVENHVTYAALGKTTGTLICPRLLLPSSSFSCRKPLNVPGRTTRKVGLRNTSCAMAQAMFSFERVSASSTHSGASPRSETWRVRNVFHQRENRYVRGHTYLGRWRARQRIQLWQGHPDRRSSRSSPRLGQPCSPLWTTWPTSTLFR